MNKCFKRLDLKVKLSQKKSCIKDKKYIEECIKGIAQFLNNKYIFF